VTCLTPGSFLACSVGGVTAYLPLTNHSGVRPALLQLGPGSIPARHITGCILFTSLIRRPFSSATVSHPATNIRDEVCSERNVWDEARVLQSVVRVPLTQPGGCVGCCEPPKRLADPDLRLLPQERVLVADDPGQPRLHNTSIPLPLPPPPSFSPSLSWSLSFLHPLSSLFLSQKGIQEEGRSGPRLALHLISLGDNTRMAEG